jgi:hypothetical protein
VKHPGLLRLPNAVAHRMMMDEGKDMITGLDRKASKNFLHGRPTQYDDTFFGFDAYSEREHDGKGLHDQIARLVLMVVGPEPRREASADPDYIQCLRGWRSAIARLRASPRHCARMATPPDAA